MRQPLAKLVRARSLLAGLWFCVLALALGGCNGPSDTGVPNPDAGPTPCAPGELTRDDGTCQPAGLPPDMPCPPGELLLEDGITCQPAGLPPDMPCPPGELLLDDGITCQKAGVPASECGEGFLPDGKDGCEPILPADPCPEGLMAIPGDTECREVAPCGSGTWGDIPVEANTEFVDQAYAGGNSDGTQAKPWTTIQEGFYAAAKGAIVAVAAGSYAEDVVIKGKPVRLWGRCPAMVEVVGTGVEVAAIVVLKNAGGAEIRAVAVTGPKFGIGVSGSSDIVIERVWIHDAGSYGLDVEDYLGPTGVVLRGSLVEQNHHVGVVVKGADATIEATVVRSTVTNAQGTTGWGIDIAYHPATKERANVSVRGCLVEQSQVIGVAVRGADATIEATVVRSTQPDMLGDHGVGIVIVGDPASMERANATVRGCLVEQSHEMGVFVRGADAVIEATVVRSSLPNASGDLGRGIVIQDDSDTKERGNATVRACLVEQNHDIGVYVEGSDATIETTVVRSTQPDALGGGGRGISVQGGTDLTERSSVTVRACVVEQNHEVGIHVAGSDVTIEATLIHSTLPNALGRGGSGLAVQDDPGTTARANVAVRACLVEQSHEIGVFVVGSETMIEATVIRATEPDALGNGGNGIAVQDNPGTGTRATLTVRACRIEQSQDVGIFVSGSDATIEETMVRSTGPNAQGDHGHGIAIQNTAASKARGNAAVRACLVEQSQDVGIFVSGSDATIEATEIRSIQSDTPLRLGRGVDIQSDPETRERANVTVRACLIEQNHEIGVFIEGSDATIEATVVSSTLPDALGEGGRGINIQRDPDAQEDSNVTIRACRVEQNSEIGVYVSHSELAIEATTVNDTVPNSDDNFGDGITVIHANVTIQDVEVTRNARAGVASFGGKVLITDGVIICNGFDLEGEPAGDISFSFDGSTGWQCSDKAPAECTELGECHVETTGIAAPSELPPVDPVSPADLPKP